MAERRPRGKPPGEYPAVSESLSVGRGQFVGRGGGRVILLRVALEVHSRRHWSPEGGPLRAGVGFSMQGEGTMSPWVPPSAGVAESRSGEGESEFAEQIDRGEDRVVPAVQVPEAVEALEGHGQEGEEPAEE